MNPLTQSKNTTILPLLIALVLVCFGLLPRAQAVLPPPDGGYPGGNTAEGQAALLSLTSGTNNTAVGWWSLKNNVEGEFNTAVGSGALTNNIGDGNTAIGGAALFSNMTGNSATAVGLLALFHNTGAGANTAIGSQALFANTIGSGNTAVGHRALESNNDGGGNTAIGVQAGQNLTGSQNICIGANVYGVAAESNTTRIGNIYSSVATVRAVYVNSDNKIGTLSSSRRYKDEIRPMAKASKAILSLKPVSFRYKKEVDPRRSLSFGLIAEEVAEVDPDLVSPDRAGKPETVRYEAVNAMLLNEFLKEHKTVEEHEATITRLKSTVAQQQKAFQATAARQQEQIEALSAGLQRVSDQLAAASPSDGGLEVGKFATGRIRRGGPAPRTVDNNQ